MLFLASNGFRCIAHDRRGHGRSSQPWDGNEMDTYADDLAALIETLDLRGVVLIGFSTGGGEVARYIGRHGTERVAGAVLVSAVPPFMLKTDDNPGGVPIEVFDGLRAGSIADRAQLYRDLADGPFFGNNRPGAKVSQGMRDSFWRQGMQSGHRNAYECIAAFSATDFRGDLAAVRRADARHPRRRRSGRALRGRRQGVRRARRRRGAQGLPRRPARHHRHAQGPAERGPAGVRAERELMAARAHRVVIVGGGFGACSRRSSCARATSRSRSSTARTTTSSSRCSTRSRPGSSPWAKSRRRSAESCASTRTSTSSWPRPLASTSRIGRCSPPGPGVPSSTFAYDSLIVAAGSTTSYFGRDELARHSLPMKTIDDALNLRRRIFAAFELAESAPSEAERQRWLTFAVVGGGPTGCEVAGQIAELARRTLHEDFRSIDATSAVRAPLRRRPGDPRDLRRRAVPQGRRAGSSSTGVEIRTETRVTSIDGGGMDVESPTRQGAHRDAHGRLGRRRAGLAARARPGRGGRRRVRSRGPGRRSPRLHAAGPPGGLRHRRRDGARRAPRRRRGRAAAGHLRRADDQAAPRWHAAERAVPLPRSREHGGHRPRPRGRELPRPALRRVPRLPHPGSSSTWPSSPASATALAALASWSWAFIGRSRSQRAFTVESVGGSDIYGRGAADRHRTSTRARRRRSVKTQRDDVHQDHHRGRRHDGLAGRLADGLSRQARDRVRRHPRGPGDRARRFTGSTRSTSSSSAAPPAKQIDDTFARLTYTTDLAAAVRDADLISESVPESMRDQGILLARGVQARPGAHRVHHQHLHAAAERAGGLRRPAAEVPGPALRHRRLGLEHRRGHGPSRHRPGRVRAPAGVRRGDRPGAHPHSQGAERLHHQQPARALVHRRARSAGARRERLPRASTEPG